MKTHNIPLESFTPKKTKIKIENGEYIIPSDESTLGKGWYHTNIPGKFKLPFRIDMTAKINCENPDKYPGAEFRWRIGKGQIEWSQGHTRRTDILTGYNKLPNYEYDKDIPANEYVKLTVMYGSKIMWIAVNDEYCYYNNNLPYIKLLQENAVPDGLKDGLGISIHNGKVTVLTVKSLTVTEYEGDEPEVPAEISEPLILTPFEWYVRSFSPEIQKEILLMDEFLLKDMKGSIKFSKAMDKYSSVFYKTPFGMQYRLNKGSHEINWVQKPNRKDYTNDIINKLADSFPELTDKLFSNLQKCDPHARECGRRTKIEYKGETKSTCASTIRFKLDPSEFSDVREVIMAAVEIMEAGDK